MAPWWGLSWGPIDGMEKRAFLARADVLLVPSVRESFGMSMAEAMAMGTTVIATEGVGAAALLRRLDTGLAVQRDQAALDAALKKLLSVDTRKTDIGQAARALASTELSWAGTAARMAAVYAGQSAGGAA